MDQPDPFGFIGLTYDDVHAAARAHRRDPERGGHVLAAHARASRCASPLLSRRDGHRHRVAHGDRDGRARAASGSCTATCPSRTRPRYVDQVKRSRVGHDHQPGHHHPRRDGRRGRRACAAATASPACPVVEGDGTLRRHHHQPRHAVRLAVRGRPTTLVRDVMTTVPLITAPVGIDRGRGRRALRPAQDREAPLVDDAGPALRGLITVKDFVKSEQYPQRHEGRRGPPRVGAAIGFFGDAWERAGALCARPGVDVLVVDTANGRLGRRARHGAPPQGRLGVRAHGGHRRQRRDPRGRPGARSTRASDAVKVGVGPGSICTTRVVAGVGVPAGDRRLRGVARGARARRPGDRRRRPAVLRRHRQGARRRRRHRDARLAAGRLRRVARATWCS